MANVKPKTRTGCLTCRARKVKCDEEKPFCRRCRVSGRECEGYDLPVMFYENREASASGTTAPGEQARPPALSRRNSPTTPSELDPTYSEHTRIIVQVATEQLERYFEAEVWQRVILPMTVSEPAVRAAILALSLLHRHPYREGGRREGQSEQTASACANPYAAQQYIRAINLLQARIDSSEPTTVVLVTSVLFGCFEALCGQQNNALQHLQASLNIMSSPQYQDVIGTTNVWDESEQQNISLQGVAPDFSELVIEAASNRDLQPLLRSVTCMALLRACIPKT